MAQTAVIFGTLSLSYKETCTRVHPRACALQRHLNKCTDFHATWSEYPTITGHYNVVFCSVQRSLVPVRQAWHLQ
jgi:hypothetical protein